jgi:hypothetical protein
MRAGDLVAQFSPAAGRKSRVANVALLEREVVKEDELEDQVIASKLLGQGGKRN